MRKMIIFVIIALAAYVGYVVWLNYHQQSQLPLTVAPTPGGPQPPIAVPSPPMIAPTFPSAPAAPPPVAQRVAPDGMYFLIQRVSVPTSEGITGLRAGTKVTRVKEDGDTVTLTTGKVEFDAQWSQVTNDLDVVGAILAQEQQRAAATADWSRQQQAAQFQQQRAAQAAAAEQSQPQAPSDQARAQQAQAATARIAAVRREIDSTQQQIRNTNRDKANAPRPLREGYQKQVNDLERRIRGLQEEERQMAGKAILVR